MPSPWILDVMFSHPEISSPEVWCHKLKFHKCHVLKCHIIWNTNLLTEAEPEWPSALQCFACCMPHWQSWVRAPNLYQCLWTHLQIHGSKRFSYHVDLYTVDRCHTRGESEDHTSKKACKESTLALKPSADITRSPKQGYQWPYERHLCPPKFF